MEHRCCEKMNTVEMGFFLEQVSSRHPKDYILMVVDGASSHKSKDLVVPANIALIGLPPYSPQLNPQERIWDELREKAFPNRVFSTMAAVREQLKNGLEKLCANAARIKSLTAWPWVKLVLS